MTVPSQFAEQRSQDTFDGSRARTPNCCVTLVGDRLVRVPTTGEPPPPLARLVHDQFRTLVLSDGFSCLGAQAALRAGQYRMGIYGELGSADANEHLARHLAAFTDVNAEREHGLTTFVASFTGPSPADEAHFERLLWAQLQALHELDWPGHGWDRSVSADPEDPRFSFSFAGRAYFVVGLHAASSRWARRFAWPTLVFNPHRQFDQLRERGTFERLRERIRDRERSLQTTLNGNLSNFGEHSEARQYSGRLVEEDWGCPFQVRGSDRTPMVELPEPKARPPRGR